jgi:rhodanese-related sulfurtransferase
MNTPHIPHITCQHLLELHEKPADEREHIIIDVRDLTDYETGHIEGALHIPRRELVNLESLVPEKDKKVIVVVGPTHEKEIHVIHDELKELGYNNTEFLAGGIDKWCEIADVEVSDVLGEPRTPEEMGIVGDEHSGEIDPEKDDNEPLY